MKKEIKNLQGRDPVGAVLSIGKKSANGFPTETDRFHIVQTMQDSNKVRQGHPAFSGFNSAQPEQRKVIRGNIIHATRDDCFEYYLKAQTLNKKQHPNKRPMCTGNGTVALRYANNTEDPNDFTEITCPDDRCEFRQGTPPECKPFSRFLFRLRWKDGSQLPTPLVKFSTGSWNTCANMVGFFDYIEKVAKQCGIEKYSLFSFPFMLTLSKKTNATKKTSFPVVTITPEQDPVQFFTTQSKNFEQLSGSSTLALCDMQGDDELQQDSEHLSLPTK